MIQIYSTELKTKTPLETRTPGHVNMYVCGPTVYDSCHIGHARPAVVFDTVRRYLEYAGYTVTFISNVTDIDDKIIARAKALGLSCAALASRHQDEYEGAMAALGVRSPTIRPKATEHVPEMIALIKGLEEKGIAYTTARGVWFDISKFKDYGRLSGRTADDENTEHRVARDADKKNPQDFALWKFAQPGEPKWESPWGPGRPGWHLECSAMGGKYADFELDLHGGGADLCFPHHENELAQSEAFTGRRFVRCWMHNGFITVPKEDGEGEKMGKSKGNAFGLRAAFRVAPPAALRLWILGTHYRAPLMYKPELLASATAGLNRIYNCLEALRRALGAGEVGGDLESAARDKPRSAENGITAGKEKFRVAMDDDFNTPRALAAVHDLIATANGALERQEPAADLAPALAALTELLGVLGLPRERPLSQGADPEAFVKLLVDIRNQARQENNFALADFVRAQLGKLGVELQDRQGETTWTLS